MTLRENKTPMKYAEYLGSAPIYDRDEDGNIQYYTESEGNRYPMDTGTYENVYGNVGEMSANISMSGSDAEAREYGLSVDQYQAVLVCDKDAYPLKEGTYIWVDSPIEYLYNGEEVEFTLRNGETITTKSVKAESADYQVVKKSNSLNVSKYILKAVNK